MSQGGGPTGTGVGDGGLAPIPGEFDPSLKFDKPGRLAMANAGPRTGACQFFIAEVPTPHLNGKHTIFWTGRRGIGNCERYSACTR